MRTDHQTSTVSGAAAFERHHGDNWGGDSPSPAEAWEDPRVERIARERAEAAREAARSRGDYVPSSHMTLAELALSLTLIGALLPEHAVRAVRDGVLRVSCADLPAAEAAVRASSPAAETRIEGGALWVRLAQTP